jgi:hypothetical protein
MTTSPSPNSAVTPDLLQTWYGANRLESDLHTVRNFWAGRGRYIVSVYASSEDYRQIFDLERALEIAVRHHQTQARLPGINIPTAFTDWGTISTAKYWGGKVQFDSTGGNIFINPVAQTVEQALALEPLPVASPQMDACRSIMFYRRLTQVLGTRHLWLRTPDMQGPLNTAGLVCNQEAMLVAMYEQPALVHAYLEKVTGFLIEYARYLRQESENRICGNLWPYTFFPQDLGISFTEDLMPLLSPRLYREFGLPQLRRLAEAFGGLHIHCCGDWGRHVPALIAANLPLRAMEYHHPHTRIAELALLAQAGTVFVPYILLHKQDQFQTVSAYYRWLLENTPAHYRYWFAFSDESPDALAFAAEFGSSG